MNLLRLFALALLAAVVTPLQAAAGNPAGTWKFSAQGPRGSNVESTLTLRYEKNQLSGWVEGPAGKAEISQAKFVDDTVSFNVVREFGRRLRKKKFTVTYTGKLENDTITGTIQTTGRGQEPVSIPWKAQRVAANATPDSPKP